MIPDILKIETASCRAWPALEREIYDGWLLRWAQGYTGRSNAVYPIYGSSLNLTEKVAYCEDAYQKRGIAPRFKMTDVAQPDYLDTYLEGQGYQRTTPTLVQTCSLAHAPARPPLPLTIQTAPTATWVDHYARYENLTAEHVPVLQQLLQRIALPSAYGLIIRDGNIAAVGMAVADEDLLGIFKLVVAPAYRRQGLGTALVQGLLHWGWQQGAQTAYLQVRSDNQSAVRLYEQIGFQTLYGYWYRFKDAG